MIVTVLEICLENGQTSCRFYGNLYKEMAEALVLCDDTLVIAVDFFEDAEAVEAAKRKAVEEARNSQLS